ncbi:phosphatidylinositol-binding protein scs2 [Apophysomyces sp. BC1034]|nr:phosphatidylinositol-binding protein scs2 [Apophysomyces sp. BC1015]KAG0179004.1 phosphatidylinositol-binding protein scs2 [Apophysomyces sp. BC1021]KAG0192113.1 phosphatidylinositol-binding protein scs2 [Apophysomyces sp. BC1034]
MASILQPSDQLTFYRPLTEVTKEILVVKNPGGEHIAFKVKTTAPKQYCVRPNAGLIEPNSEVEVQIILQPFREEPPVDFKCKDKFLVQTAAIKPGYASLSVADLWGSIETESKEKIHQHKLRCLFMPPAMGTNEIIPVTEAPVAERIETTEATQTTPELVPAVVEQPPVQVQDRGDNAREIEKKLSEAHATIGRLQQQLEQSEQSLRMRQNAANSARSVSATVQPSDAVHQHLAQLEKPHATEGYPPQIVLLVAALVFIVTYLFF